MTLALILGRSDSFRADVFLRAALPNGVDPSDAVLAGTLTGPECRRAITLPVTAKFAGVRGSSDVAAAESIVAKVILTEPSYWTPELPTLYRLDARLVVGGSAVARWHRTVGLRRLGVRGRSLWLDGRRFVPRGLLMPEAAFDIERFRDAMLTAVVADPSELLLDRCDGEGVPVIGLLTETNGAPLDVMAAADRINRWAWHASALMAFVPTGAREGDVERIAAATRSVRATLLLACEVDGSVAPPVNFSAADALIVTLGAGALPHRAWQTAVPSLPLIPRRADSSLATAPAPSRRPCDMLQADLAAWSTASAVAVTPWDWAGYCVDVGS